MATRISYDRANFSDRFDGGVNYRNHTVTLTMRLAINDAVGADGLEVKAARINYDDRCYGVVFEQKNDLMGYGSEITPCPRNAIPGWSLSDSIGRKYQATSIANDRGRKDIGRKSKYDTSSLLSQNAEFQCPSGRCLAGKRCQD
jgi:hypothetical protein